MRGEYSSQSQKSGTYCGSPLHAWGIQRTYGLSVRMGFTPTCVGNTETRSVPEDRNYGSPPHAWGIRPDEDKPHRNTSVHPHMRGEYITIGSNGSPHLGSPPHAWGIRISCLTAAGIFCGSPPHAWGITLSPARRRGARRFAPTCVGNTRLDSTPSVRQGRFTPTCVGNTRYPVEQVPMTAVHPHMRGEYVCSVASVSASAVHPHMRGEYW